MRNGRGTTTCLKTGGQLVIDNKLQGLVEQGTGNEHGGGDN